ncbi:MAG TPA: DUF1376 domain-containing protein [Phyllobacterium sp.]|nr:DUF1376 domain-containing protein [Phyllobacterium sp.]
MSNLIFPIDVARYTNDTNHLTCEQDGAYWRILRKMWTEGGSIPNDERTLSMVCGLSLKKWRAISSPIMSMLVVIDGRLSQKRLAADLAQLTAAKSKAGKASGAARKVSARGSSNRFESFPAGTTRRHDVSDKQLNLLNGHEQVFPNAQARVDTNLSLVEITGKNKDSANAESEVVELAVEAYSTLAEKIGLPTIRALNDERQRKLVGILSQYGGLPVWNEALSKVESSHFLRGENDRGWVASFDFLLQPSSFLKLIEGRYNDRALPQQHAHSPPQLHSSGDEIDEIIRREREKELRNAKH